MWHHGAIMAECGCSAAAQHSGSFWRQHCESLAACGVEHTADAASKDDGVPGDCVNDNLNWWPQPVPESFVACMCARAPVSCAAHPMKHINSRSDLKTDQRRKAEASSMHSALTYSVAISHRGVPTNTSPACSRHTGMQETQTGVTMTTGWPQHSPCQTSPMQYTSGTRPS